MEMKKNRNLLSEAINSGYQTVAQLARFLRVRTQEGYCGKAILK